MVLQISISLTQTAETCGQPLEVVAVEEPSVDPALGYAMNELTDSDPDTQKRPLEESQPWSPTHAWDSEKALELGMKSGEDRR